MSSADDLGQLWVRSPSLTSVPLAFGSALSPDSVTLIDAEEGSLSLSFDGTQSALNVETGGDTYTSTVDNLSFTPGLNSNRVGGENLTFSSTTTENRTTIDRFSFRGNESEFRFELQDFDTTGPTNWGGESLSFRRSDSGDKINSKKLYIRKENGEFIEIGEADYSESNNSLRMTSVLGQSDGHNFSADQVSLIRRGNTDIGQATNLYIDDGTGEFISVGTADVRVSPERTSLALTSLTGNKDGYDFSGDTFNYTEVNGSETANATGVFIKNANGEFVQIGEADYSEQDKSLNMTSIIGSSDGYDFSADQLNLMQRGNTDIGQATNLYIAKGPGDFVAVGTADVRVSPDRSSLALTSLTGSKDGYDFSADTFNYTEVGGWETINATGIFIKNQDGEFIQIGDADYLEENKSLNMTSLLGEYDGYDFSADSLSLFQRGNTDIGQATNLYISMAPGEFVSVGSANLEMGPNGDRLNLISITGESNGYKLSADELNALDYDGNTEVEIVNGLAVGDSERLSFGNALINSDGETISADVTGLSFSSGDLSYSANSLIGSTNGETFDLNTTGVLRSGGTNLDLSFEGRGVNSVTMSGPAEDGGILIENGNDGRLIRAEGTVAIGTTEDGGFSNIGVALGDTISFSATDADGNARELSASFSYDEAAGKFYLRTVFKGGDQTEIKVMPFKFTSEKIGDDAVAALSASLEKQNIEEYLNTISGIIDLERINDFIAVGRDRMQVRLGREKGLEFYYADNNLSILDYQDDWRQNGDGRDIALGLGFFNRGVDDSVSSGGILLSSDSGLRYNIEAGTLSFNGIELPDQGEIPLTIGTYYRHEDAEGNAIFGTLGTSLADLGTVSAGVAVERRLNEYTTYSAGIAGNTHGEVAASVGFKVYFSKVNDSNRRLSGNSYYDPSDISEIVNSVNGFRSQNR